MKSNPPQFLNFRRDDWIAALYVGGLCGALVVLMAQGRLGGILVNYLPTMLLCGLGWVRGVRTLGLAALIAMLFCLAGAPAASTGFLIGEALPSLLLLRLSLTYFAVGQTRQEHSHTPMALHVVPAFSIGWALSAVAVYGACILAIFSLIAPAGAGLTLTNADWNSLDPMLAPFIPDAASRKDAILRLRDYLFLFVGLIGWLWVLGLYACAALSRYLAQGMFPVAPRRLSLAPFNVPVALLAMLAAFGAGGLLLPPDTLPSLLLKSAFVLLMFPYFLSGVAQLFGRLPQRQSRALWTMLLGLGLLIFPAAALIFIAMGVLHPLKSASPKGNA